MSFFPFSYNIVRATSVSTSCGAVVFISHILLLSPNRYDLFHWNCNHFTDEAGISLPHVLASCYLQANGCLTDLSLSLTIFDADPFLAHFLVGCGIPNEIVGIGDKILSMPNGQNFKQLISQVPQLNSTISS